MSDIKALIAEARDPKGHVNPVLSGGIIDRLAAALEAAQQTPADIPFVLRRAMHHHLSPVLGRARLTPETDPGEQWDAAVETTIAEVLESLQQTPAPSVQEVLDLLDAFHGDNRMSYDAYTNLHDAIAVLEAAQQAIAVDREALAAVIHERFNIARGRGGVAPLALADQILASGILLDAAEVEARGLEKAEKIARDVEAEAVVKRDESDYPESHYGQHLDGQARGAQVVAQRIAQQVQESN